MDRCDSMSCPGPTRVLDANRPRPRSWLRRGGTFWAPHLGTTAVGYLAQWATGSDRNPKGVRLRWPDTAAALGLSGPVRDSSRRLIRKPQPASSNSQAPPAPTADTTVGGSGFAP